MGISKNNITSAKITDLFYISHFKLYFFNYDGKLESISQGELRRDFDYHVDPKVVAAVNASTEQLFHRYGYADEAQGQRESFFDDRVMETYLGLSYEQILEELTRRGEKLGKIRAQRKSTKEFHDACLVKFPSLYNREGMSFLLVRPDVKMGDAFFWLSFSLRRYGEDQSTKPISVKEYSTWLLPRKKEFFAMVKATIANDPLIQKAIGSISFYRLTDCIITQDSTVELSFSVKPELEKVFEVSAEDEE